MDVAKEYMTLPPPEETQVKSPNSPEATPELLALPIERTLALSTIPVISPLPSYLEMAVDWLATVAVSVQTITEASEGRSAAGIEIDQLPVPASIVPVLAWTDPLIATLTVSPVRIPEVPEIVTGGAT